MNCKLGEANKKKKKEMKRKSHKLLAHASVLTGLLATQWTNAAILAGVSIKTLTVIRSRKRDFGYFLFSTVNEKCEILCSKV
jgi:hypothetical protein